MRGGAPDEPACEGGESLTWCVWPAARRAFAHATAGTAAVADQVRLTLTVGEKRLELVRTSNEPDALQTARNSPDRHRPDVVPPRQHAVVEGLCRVFTESDRLAFGSGPAGASQVPLSDTRSQADASVDDLLHRPHCGLRPETRTPHLAIDQFCRSLRECTFRSKATRDALSAAALHACKVAVNATALDQDRTHVRVEHDRHHLEVRFVSHQGGRTSIDTSFR